MPKPKKETAPLPPAQVIAAQREEIRLLKLQVVRLTQERDTARHKLGVSRRRVQKWRQAAARPARSAILPS